MEWATKAANALDPRSATVAFIQADRAQRKGDWASAFRFAFTGFGRMASNDRASTLSRADLLIAASTAVIAACPAGSSKS